MPVYSSGPVRGAGVVRNRPDLVVLSSAAAQTARAASRAAREVSFSAPRLRVLAGRPGDTLSQLLTLARAG
jgi:hypothetical protein